MFLKVVLFSQAIEEIIVTSHVLSLEIYTK